MSTSDAVKFIRQDSEMLFPKVLYNRPVTRNGAGRLLIPGGHTGELSLPTAMHQLANAAGIGECQVALPDVLAKFLAGAPDTTFVPSSPSGSLGSEALGQLLRLSEDADGVALGASLSNNSHTAILVERLLQELERPAVIFADALTALQNHTELITARPNNLVILTMPEVFKLCSKLQVYVHIRRDGGLLNKLEIVQALAAASQCQYVVYGSEIIVAAGEDIIVTPVNWRLSLMPAAYWAILATFWLQQPQRQREALATASYILSQAGQSLSDTNRPSVAGIAAAIHEAITADEF